jgi:hypothetical protein
MQRLNIAVNMKPALPKDSAPAKTAGAPVFLIGLLVALYIVTRR